MNARARLTAAGPDARCLSPSKQALDRHAASIVVPVVAGPVRTCVGCRVAGLRSVLLRVVVALPQSGSIPVLVVDSARSLPGRGAWLHPEPHCLELAERRHAFGRALRIPGPVDSTAVHQHLEAERQLATGTSGDQ